MRNTVCKNTPVAQKVRKVFIYIGLAVVFIVVVGCLSIAIKHRNSEIKALKSEVAAKTEQINTIRADLQLLKDEMVKAQRVGESHIQTTIKAGDEYVNKINTIQIDSDARDWLDEPLPASVVYNYSERLCKDSSD